MPDGKPAAGVRVGAQGPAVSMIGLSDNSGAFRIENLPPGQYEVFAAAQASTVTEAGETMHIAIISRLLGPRRLGDGTYFPSRITVSPGATVENIDIALSPRATPFIDVPVHILRAKLVAEGGGIPTIGSYELSLMISDAPANITAPVIFVGGFPRPASSSIRFESLQGPLVLTSMVPMPQSPDGQFRLVLPEGVYRVSQQGPIRTSPRDSRYYVKGLSFGTVDVMKGLMTVKGPIQDELVITLAKCTTDSTKEPMCR